MSRNSGGLYSLPAGNPVVTGTAISSTWVNNTLTDIKTEITDSLSRSNKGGMLAQLQLFAGTESVPGLAWGDDTDTGFYYAAGKTRFSVDGTLKLELGGSNTLFYTSVAIHSTQPVFDLKETDADTDEKIWRLTSVGGNLTIKAANDADNSSTTPLSIVRTGTVIDSITLTATGISLTGAVTATSFTTVKVLSTLPRLVLNESDAASDEKVWEFRVDGGNLYLYTDTDAESAVGTPMGIVRTGTTVDSITFQGTQINLSGTAVAVNADLGVSGALIVGGINLTPASGSFSAELATASSGGTVRATDTAYWRKVNGVVTLRLPPLLTISTDTGLYIRNIPAAIQPSITGTNNQCVAVPGKINGTFGILSLKIIEGSAWWFLTGTLGGFTAGSAEKGIGEDSVTGVTISYTVAD